MQRITFILVFTVSMTNYVAQEKNSSTEIVRVRFLSKLRLSEQENLKMEGIQFLEYLGNQTYLIDDPKQILEKYQSAIQSKKAVDINDKFIRFSPSKYRNRYENFIVRIYSSKKLSDFQSLLSEYKILKVDSPSNLVYIRANEEEILSLANNSFVQYLEVDDALSEPEGLLDLGNKRSTTISLSANYVLQLNGSGIHLAIQDDGNVNDHVDFKNRLLDNVSNNGGAHGDLCSGTMVAAGNRDPLGMGAAWGADHHVYGVSGYPLFDNSTINQLYSTKNIYITNTSYSDGCNKGYTTQSRNIDVQIRSNNSLMHVISAGNNGTMNCSYGAGNYWGTITGGHKTAKNCITAGSVTSLDAMSDFSSRGPSKDGRLKPEVCADGHEIFTTGNRDNYNLAKGTSQSAPGIAGVLAQLYQGYKDKTGTNAPSSLIKAVLMNGCEDLHNNGPDFRTGYGRINAWRSWKMIDNGNYFNNNVAQGDSNIHTITLPSNAKSLRVMLYYHDKDANPNAVKDLVNDLNMRLVHSSGTLLPWVLNPAANAATIDNPAVRGIDSLNNHEQITMNNPLSGSYQIIVKGHDIPLGVQSYVVVYEVLMDEIRLIYPAGGEAIARGEEHIFRWDASHNTGSFRLEISDATGSSWITIDNNIAGDKRWYKYTIPQGASYSGIYKCRISRNGIADTSNNFSIMNRPENIRLEWVCSDSAKIVWDTVPGTNQYKVYKLGFKYMDSIAVTPNTYFIAKGLNPLEEDLFSSQAIGPNSALSRRGYGVVKERGMFNCSSQVDIKLAAVISPEGNLYNCVKRDSLKIVLRIVNNGMTISSLPISYYYNKNPLATDTINQTISINTDNTITLTKTIAGRTSGFDSLMIWCAHPSDAYRANDTLLLRWNNLSASNMSIPFVEEFDTYADADTAYDCNTDHTMPLPWLNEPNNFIDEMDWRIRSGATPSEESGPNGDTTTAAANGKYLFVQSGNCEDFMAKVNLGCIDLDTAINPFMTYFYSMNGNNMGEHRVEVFANGKWNTDTLPRVIGYQGSAWKQQRVDLTPYTGQKIMIRWTAKVKGELGSDIAIDRIKIQDTIYRDTITLARNPMAGGTVNGNGIYNRNSIVTITATPYAGYSFTNWTENGNTVSTNVSYTFTITSNRNLVANFTQNIINDTIQIIANPMAGGNTAGAGIYTRNSSVTVVATANAGFSFANWTENGSSIGTNPSYTFTITSNRNLVAKFTPNVFNYTISTSSSPSLGGNTTGGGTYANGSPARVTATANLGYRFTYWTENSSVVSVDSSYLFTVSGNRNLVANFAPNPVYCNVTTSANPAAGGTTLGNGTYTRGSNVTVTATANNGFVFTNWKENGIVVSSNSTYQLSITSNRNLVANFNPITNSIQVVQQNQIQVFPNPVNSFVNVVSESPIQEISITDVLGKPILRTHQNLGQSNHTIPLINIESGIYFIHIKTLEKTIKTKLIVEK